MRYIAVRLMQSALTLILFMIVIFVATRAAGDPAQLLLPPDATPEEVQATRHRFGTDRPYVEQFAGFVEDMATLNFGRSVVHREKVTDLLASRLGASASLTLSAVLLVVLTAVPLGVLAATHRGGISDRVVRGVAAFGQASPPFWVGLLLIEFFSVRFHLLPAGGFPSDGSVGAEYYVLPAITIGLQLFAALTRLLRSSMLESLDAEFVKLARAKGLSEVRVVWIHVLRNALLPILSLMAIWVGTAIVVSVVTEVVFNWPGVGNLFLSSILARDFPVIQAVVALVGTTVLLANLLADVLYVVVDPRIRVSTGLRQAG